MSWIHLHHGDDKPTMHANGTLCTHGIPGTNTAEWAATRGLAPDGTLLPISDSQVDNLLAELEAAPEVAYSTHDELLTALDELLDNALHSEECYIDPDDTHCTCVIGKVRAVLPRCEATQPKPRRPFEENVVWRCQRSAHPASPDRHVFGEV